MALLGLFALEGAFGQTPDFPFRSGEYLRYGAYYNWHFVWIHSGEVEFTADTMQYMAQKTWRFNAVGKTFNAYDLLFTVRDTFTTFCRYSDFNLMYSRRSVNHGKGGSIHQYWNDPSKGQTRMQISRKGVPDFKTIFETRPGTYDLLATAYYFRKLDFNALFVGQKVPYRMIIDRKVDDLYFHYLGKESVKTRNGHEYLCHKVSVYLLQGDFFPEGEYMKIWFTDDKNHLPVQVESEIMVGSVKAVLLEAKSLKYPLTAQKK